METLAQKIQRLVTEDIGIVPYDSRWPEMFVRERDYLRSSLPPDLIKRIEHFGSTAVPGLAAKPIVDLLVEVTSLEETKIRIAPVLESQGYEYLWRPTHGDDVPPFYAWFIKRDPSTRARTHHIHMVEAGFPHWESLLFRDYLIDHPEVAREYERLKVCLAAGNPGDRVAYTHGKAQFVRAVTDQAKRLYKKA
jgi:GrpB-like predicted nucleotidyltransferase (UPF0157 family)